MARALLTLGLVLGVASCSKQARRSESPGPTAAAPAARPDAGRDNPMRDPQVSRLEQLIHEAEAVLDKTHEDAPEFAAVLADLRRKVAADLSIPDAEIQAEVDRRDQGARDFPGYPERHFLHEWLGVRGALADALADRHR
jgi:hypothetical protein